MDAPARSFVLGIKGHNGYFSCTRCIELTRNIITLLVLLKASQ
ncbi:hypothetical protein FF38_00801 [Lucilia cuprina]|uniref:Uncharacterized protein n=1 Tax=Lucilia cuprina TaxID=7375 RepID=A0A0L0C3T0_LUCCU|nr:hypothetical protein FF38_00801 [Lucilia cuprina]